MRSQDPSPRRRSDVAILVAADAALTLARHDAHGRPHGLHSASLGVQQLEVQLEAELRQQGRNLKIGVEVDLQNSRGVNTIMSTDLVDEAAASLAEDIDKLRRETPGDALDIPDPCLVGDERVGMQLVNGSYQRGVRFAPSLRHWSFDNSDNLLVGYSLLFGEDRVC